MATIITRSGKGSPLTNTEVDNNFTNLNSDKLESGDTVASLTLTSADINGGTIDGTVIGGSTPAAISGTTGQFGTSLNVDGTVTADGLTVDGNSILGALPYNGDMQGSQLFVADASAPQINIGSSGTSSGSYASPILTSLSFRGYLGNERARISSWDVSGNSANDGRLLFSTKDASGVQTRMLIASNGDISFYEDTGTTPKFFWDASAESLGIGTSSPSAKLDLGTSTGQKLLMYADSNIRYGMSIETSEYRLFAEDQAVMTFGGMARADGTTFYEHMRIDSSGNVLCGSDGGGDIGSSTKRFKDLYLSGGVYLGGTGAANLLDDYEEGTWTPAFVSGTGLSYQTQAGRYTKVGNVVLWNFELYWLAGSSIVGQVTGLPFTVAAVTGNYPMTALRTDGGTTYDTGRTSPIAYPVYNSTYIQLECIGSGVNAAALTFGTTGALYASGHYTTSA